MKQFFGKYRGKVENNIDPLMQGRIQVSCSAVLGDGQLSWAMPCVPYAGKGVGFYVVPPIGANIWVEFEGGDPDYPIWSGCFWGTGEVPELPALPQKKVFKTDSTTITINDLPGLGFSLEVGAPAVPIPLKFTCDASGIEISGGAAKIKMTPAVNMVSINDGALEVI